MLFCLSSATWKAAVKQAQMRRNSFNIEIWDLDIIWNLVLVICDLIRIETPLCLTWADIFSQG